MKIYTENGDRQRIYIDVGAGDQVTTVMRKNMIWVESWNGDVATFNTERYSSRSNARMLGVLVDFYQKNGWEVSESVLEILKEHEALAEEERRRIGEKNRLEELKKEEERKRRGPCLYKKRVYQKRSRYFLP